MRILTIHSDFIEFQPLSKAIKNPEPVELEKKRVEECLVVFTSVEEGDTKEVLEDAKREIVNIANQVKVKKIVIYPFVHLSSKPAKPDIALSYLKEMEKIEGFEVIRAPFGWYKEFNIKCKGHPLAELSRVFEPKIKGEEKEVVSESLKKESKLMSKFYIMTVDGELIDAEKFDYTGYENLKKFVNYEMKKIRVYEKEPPHIKLMKEHSLVSYEPGSDPGHFRWLPKGVVMKKILENIVLDWCKEIGAIEVETPIMYDFEHPALLSYLHRFPARQYVVKSEDKELFLRFAACFGQFLALHDMVISYKNLPLKVVELAKYCFRREQSGELAGLKRLRAFTMADMHTVCEDIESAKEEFELQFKKSLEWIKMLNLETETAFRAEKEFFEKNKNWYLKMIKETKKPALIELFDVRYAYFITKFEFNFIDTLDKASALSTVQIDVENADVYDISYIDKDGKKKRPIILHASLSGGIERCIYALLEREASKIERGEIPSFPLFLSPTQVRIIPVSMQNTEQIKYAEKIAKELLEREIRVDIDDRLETLNKKIMEAEKEWIPYIVVIGDKEVKDKTLSVRKRENREVSEMDINSLVNEINEKIKSVVKGYKFEPLSLPMYLSKRCVI